MAEILGLTSLAAGISLIVYAIATGQAHLVLLVIIPAVTGSSLPFFLGLLLIVVGFVLLFAQAAEFDGIAPPESRMTGGGALGSPKPTTERAWGGVLLLGPFPIAFGSARPLRRWMYLALALVGSVALVGAVIAFLRL
ncbi:MAG: DUF131 domain-containing protein [Thermoplasmata archaeon]|nr:DUF131 domain-containing protein [Thermoplasmata archaeon]